MLTQSIMESCEKQRWLRDSRTNMPLASATIATCCLSRRHIESEDKKKVRKQTSKAMEIKKSEVSKEKTRKLTYQSNQEEEHEKCSSQDCLAINVAVPHSGHGDDEEVNTCPIGELLRVVELERVAGILQLGTETRSHLIKIPNLRNKNNRYQHINETIRVLSENKFYIEKKDKILSLFYNS